MRKAAIVSFTAGMVSALMGAALLLSSCALPPAAPLKGPLPDEKPRMAAARPALMNDREISYECNNGRRAQVTLMGMARARLVMADVAVDMMAVRAVSGAKYASADGHITFWSHAAGAQITTRHPAAVIDCVRISAAGP